MINVLKKHKLLLMSLTLVVFLTACKRITDENGQVLSEFVLSLDTTFGQAWKDGLFTAILVYPISLVVNFLATVPFLGAGGSIIVVTLFVNALTTKTMIKQQIMVQKQQVIQPELAKINAKYEGRNDQQSMMRKNQEMQALFAKHNINPLAGILPMLIQMPILFAMYAAIQRSINIINGEFFGVHLSKNVQNALSDSNAWAYILIFVLMVITNFVSFKLPQILTKRKQKEEGIKEKKYAQNKNAPNAESTMNTMMYVMIGMTALFGWIWPIGMSLYWVVGSIARILQSLYIYKYHSLKN